MRNRHSFVVLLTSVVSLAFTACGSYMGDSVRTGPVKTQSIALDVNGDEANLELEMAAGELKVRGGSSKLVDGRFEYNVPEWQPEVKDTKSGQTQSVVIKQGGHGHGGGGNTRNNWDVELNDKVLMDLKLDCGAGKARLDVGDLNLRRVDVNMGAGLVDLDLEGHPAHDYSVSVQGGVGQATVRLPQNVGVRAEAHGGLGSIDVQGLTKHDDYYSNNLYGKAKVNIDLRVNGGVGQIRILD